MAEELANVVAFIFWLLWHLAFTLFYSCSPHSFISIAFAEQALLGLEPLENTHLVSIPSEKLLEVTHRVRAGRVTVSYWEFEADLIVLAMVDFDIILGMDWLSVNRAVIDCESRMVISRHP